MEANGVLCFNTSSKSDSIPTTEIVADDDRVTKRDKLPSCGKHDSDIYAARLGEA